VTVNHDNSDVTARLTARMRLAVILTLTYVLPPTI
jgi:hypothetical protein